MNVQSTGAGFAAKCPRCPWRTTSQTRAVAEQRAAEHEAVCGK